MQVEVQRGAVIKFLTNFYSNGSIGPHRSRPKRRLIGSTATNISRAMSARIAHPLSIGVSGTSPRVTLLDDVLARDPLLIHGSLATPESKCQILQSPSRSIELFCRTQSVPQEKQRIHDTSLLSVAISQNQLVGDVA